jgi:hypothetical protein
MITSQVLMNVSAYHGTIIELESPQIAPWLFEAGPMPFLQGIGIMLLPCTFKFMLMGTVELSESLLVAQNVWTEIPMSQCSPTSVGSKLPFSEDPGLLVSTVWIVLGAAIGLGAISVIIGVALLPGNLALRVIPQIMQKIKIPFHIFAIDDWRLSTMFEFSAWYHGWLVTGIG